MDGQEKLIEQLEAHIAGVVLGKTDVVRMCVVALLAGEHVLLEDVPGVGKTLVGKAGHSISGQFRRIQFTPDLLPADITGSSLYDARTTSSRSAPARCLPMSSWPTRSTGPRRTQALLRR